MSQFMMLLKQLPLPKGCTIKSVTRLYHSLLWTNIVPSSVVDVKLFCWFKYYKRLFETCDLFWKSKNSWRRRSIHSAIHSWGYFSNKKDIGANVSLIFSSVRLDFGRYTFFRLERFCWCYNVDFINRVNFTERNSTELSSDEKYYP